MVTPRHKTPVVFYRTASGADVVRDWIKELGQQDRHLVGQDLMRVQFRWPVGMPLCRSLGDGLWEVRTDMTNNKIARVIFCIVDGHILALHAFVKKTRKTPTKDLDLARRRQREFV